LCSDNYKYSPLEVQFFTSLGSVVALIPICYFSVDFSSQSYNFLSLVLFILNGISFNCQSLLAFTLMSYISPVTYSVCNTLKRAVLIWFSVIIFQNQVGYMSAIGTFLIISGVLFYNNSKTLDKQFKNPVTHKI
jgi:solute carrier family 35 protein E2